VTQLLAFGDSNTHGTKPMLRKGMFRRYKRDERWPRLTAKQLGWSVAEAGLPGRTTHFEDPLMGRSMDGRLGLDIALKSHAPIDYLTIMLGTNDTKTRFGATPEQITAGMACLLDIALNPEMQERHDGFQVLVICPPQVLETGALAGEFIGATAKSAALPGLYADLAQARGVGFMDAGAVVESSQTDGIHLEPEAQPKLAAAAAKALTELG